MDSASMLLLEKMINPMLAINPTKISLICNPLMLDLEARMIAPANAPIPAVDINNP